EQALLRADQRKDEFLATLAHELRNPLAPMVNAMTLLASDGADAGTTARAHEIVSRQLGQLVRLVDDLLDVSRITSGKLLIKKETVELSTVIQNAIDTVRPLLESREHPLTVELPANPVYLQADPVRLAQVFSNLLNNAAKYSDPGGAISITSAVSDGLVEVRITDGGVGISLAKQLVELHGGTIEADSPGVGRGSIFIVRLPVRAALTAERPSDVLAAARDASAQPRQRVLLVDDNVDFASSLALLLEGM